MFVLGKINASLSAFSELRPMTCHRRLIQKRLRSNTLSRHRRRDADKRTFRLSICISGRVEMRDYTVDSQSPPLNEFSRHHRPQYRYQSPIRPRPFAAKWNQNQPPWIFKGHLLSLLIHIRDSQTDFENKIWRSCAYRFREIWKLNCHCRTFNNIDTEWDSRRRKTTNWKGCHFSQTLVSDISVFSVPTQRPILATHSCSHMAVKSKSRAIQYLHPPLPAASWQADMKHSPSKSLS